MPCVVCCVAVQVLHLRVWLMRMLSLAAVRMTYSGVAPVHGCPHSLKMQAVSNEKALACALDCNCAVVLQTNTHQCLVRLL